MAAATAATLRGKIGQETVRGQTNWQNDTAFAQLAIVAVDGPHKIKDVLTADLMAECGCAGWSTDQYIAAWANGDNDSDVHIVSFRYIPLPSPMSGANGASTRSSRAKLASQLKSQTTLPVINKEDEEGGKLEEKEAEGKDGKEVGETKEQTEAEAEDLKQTKSKLEWEKKMEMEVKRIEKESEEREFEKLRLQKSALEAGRLRAVQRMKVEEDEAKAMAAATQKKAEEDSKTQKNGGGGEAERKKKKKKKKKEKKRKRKERAMKLLKDRKDDSDTSSDSDTEKKATKKDKKMLQKRKLIALASFDSKQELLYANKKIRSQQRELNEQDTAIDRLNSRKYIMEMLDDLKA